MTSVVICEKPSQAANVRAAVGTRYGVVLAAQGHLLRLEEPQEVNPGWAKWTTVVLVPPKGRYGYRPDTGSGKLARLSDIEKALATADRVILATDCDREGQAIGQSLIEFFAFKGEVLRAMFTAEDEVSVREAFAKAELNAKYHPLYDAAMARQQADQIENLTLTRVCTVALQNTAAAQIVRGTGDTKRAIGVGRVKTPTLAIVCQREREIAEFQPRPFFEIATSVAGPHGTVELWHRPRGETRIYDEARAKEIASAVAAFHGPVAVARNSKRAMPPKPFDLPSLQKWAGRWGWSAKRVLDTAQALYETHKIATYPRSETRFLPDSLTDQAPRLLVVLTMIPSFGGSAPTEPVIRSGKGAVYSDRGVAGSSHHAIIPNVNVGDELACRYDKLNADERKLFDVIARGWLAAVSPDHEFDETVMAITVRVGEQDTVFSATGKVETVEGWRGVFGDNADDGPADEAVSVHLPPFMDGEVIKAERCRLITKITSVPGRYSEGDLIDAMTNAWRFVEDPTERERLKDAKGIGTPATRATVIEGLKEQGLVQVEKAKLKPTELGMTLYGLLKRAAPELVDPGATARMEHGLDEVLAGVGSIDSVVAAVAARTTILVAGILRAAATMPKVAYQGRPSAKMLVAARAKQKREGLKRLPNGVADDFDRCRAFLGPLPERAEAVGASVASDRQMAVIKAFVTKGAAPPDGYPGSVSMDMARAFLSVHLATKTGA